MSNVDISWVKYVIGDKDFRMIYVLVPLGSRESDWMEEEESVDTPHIGIIENKRLIAYAPIPDKYKVLMYSEGFRRIAREYIDGRISYIDVLNYFRIDIDELKLSSKIVYPENEEVIVVDNALLMVLMNEMIAVLGGEKTLYLRASKNTEYLEYIPGIPPRKLVEDETRTKYELVGIINDYPKPEVENRELRDKTDTIKIIESYPVEDLLLYSAFKESDIEYIRRIMNKFGDAVPISETLTSSEIEVLKNLIDAMKNTGIGDWRTLQVAVAFSILFDRDLEEVYNYLLGRYMKKEEEF